MGGVCSIGAAVDKSLDELSFDDNVFEENDRKQFHYKAKAQSKNKTTPVLENMEKKPCIGESTLCEKGPPSSSVSSKEPKLSKHLSRKSKTNKSKSANQIKVSDVGSILGRAGTVGLGKAVEVLDTFGSSMTSLNSNSGFISGVTKKGNKISILAFEVANTIVKGSNLMQSLSKENVKYLKEVVFPSEGVQNLISNDMDEFLMLAAADKRQELKVFSGEVVRFGNRSKDPQWHNLDRYFAKLESGVTPQKHLKETVTGQMQYLMTLVQHTAALYHELHALDRFEQDYRRRLQEGENSVAFQRGDTLQIIRQELKNQRKHVISLKKKSLWSKILEDIMEKLVDIVHFLHLEIHNAFRIADVDKSVKRSTSSHQRLGSAGLALHYANIVTQIDTLVSRSSSVPPSIRDALYQALPPTVKSTLRNKLQSFQADEELTAPQIRAEMEKTLQWLVPIANNTTRAHHGFGWVGEWANAGNQMNQNLDGQLDLIKMETLHHADKEQIEAIILDLVAWLHRLISKCRAANGGINPPIKSLCILTQKRTTDSSVPRELTKETHKTVQENKYGKLTSGDNKSRQLSFPKPRLSKHDAPSRSSSSSSSHSSTRVRESTENISTTRRPAATPLTDFDAGKHEDSDEIDNC